LSPAGDSKPRVGISECLLGRAVRYDGGHKRSRLVCESLATFVDYVAVCPEVEVGLGVPRESLRLVADGERIQLIGNDSGNDYTQRMQTWARERVGQLADLELDGYVLKKNSPSCGLERVPLHRAGAAPEPRGSGVFAAALRCRLPALPVIEESQLDSSPGQRELFLTGVFTHHRLRAGLAATCTRAALAELHAAHQLLYAADRVGRLHAIVDRAPDRLSAQLRDEYIAEAMSALSVPPSTDRAVARERVDRPGETASAAVRLYAEPFPRSISR
jgi:uncharacterized protein YbbK (DUF523 family)